MLLRCLKPDGCASEAMTKHSYVLKVLADLIPSAYLMARYKRSGEEVTFNCDQS